MVLWVFVQAGVGGSGYRRIDGWKQRVSHLGILRVSMVTLGPGFSAKGTSLKLKVEYFITYC